jgi:ABC-type Na+ transport system ATPase subunit NatA
MSEETQQQILETLREIRDGQREMLSFMAAQRGLAEEQINKSRASIEESVGLQRLAMRRQRTIARIAVPGIVACVAAIAYLVLRYL